MPSLSGQLQVKPVLKILCVSLKIIPSILFYTRIKAVPPATGLQHHFFQACTPAA